MYCSSCSPRQAGGKECCNVLTALLGGAEEEAGGGWDDLHHQRTQLVSVHLSVKILDISLRVQVHITLLHLHRIHTPPHLHILTQLHLTDRQTDTIPEAVA